MNMPAETDDLVPVIYPFGRRGEKVRITDMTGRQLAAALGAFPPTLTGHRVVGARSCAKRCGSLEPRVASQTNVSHRASSYRLASCVSGCAEAAAANDPAAQGDAAEAPGPRSFDEDENDGRGCR
jgi:hypothetical protein